MQCRLVPGGLREADRGVGGTAPLSSRVPLGESSQGSSSPLASHS